MSIETAIPTRNLRVLVTGASGFLGKNLIPALAADHDVIAASRSYIGNTKFRAIPDLNEAFDWLPLLEGVDAIVHLAGVAHRPSTSEEFDRVNHRATARLAEAASRANIKHMVFISSIGAQSGPSSRTILTEEDDPRPTTPYGLSKLAAENAIKRFGVPVTILRPVIVDGENAKGNIRTLHKIASLRVPLPIKGISAKRSILSSNNFNTAVKMSIGNEKMFGQTFIVADSRPMTVGEIVSSFRERRGRHANLFAIPEVLVKISLMTFGMGRLWERLGEPLVASPQKLISFGWNPILGS